MSSSFAIVRSLRWVLGILTIVCLAGPSFAQSSPDRVHVDIPAQSLSSALTQFGRTTGTEIVFSPEAVNRKTSTAVKGDFPRDKAMALLLGGTGLTYRITPQGAFVVDTSAALERHPDSTSRVAAPPTERRLADTNTDSTGGSVPGATSKEGQSTGLSEIVVTGRYEFLSVDTSGTTNLPLPIEKVPQSISLVSNDFIEAADLKTLGQIAEYTPGAINVGSSENYQSSIFLRGFVPGRAIDGLPSAFSYYEPDYAIFDRLEVVKGPSSVVYGISSPGGLVNFVTKSATAQTADYVSAQFGSWHNFRFEGQVAGALDSDGHVRAIGIVVQDQGDSFLNEMYHRKTSVYGGINIDFSDSITAYVHGGYERFERPSFDGNPTLPDGSAAPVSRSFCVCSESIVMTTPVYHAEGDLSWRATDMWDLSLKGNYEHSKTTGDAIYSLALTDNGDLQTAASTLDWLVENYSLGASSVYKFDSLGLKNSFLSVSALYQSSYSNVAGLNAYGAGNIFAGQAAISQGLDSLVSMAQTSGSLGSAVEKTTNTTVSAQSVLQVLDPLNVLLGVSYSKPDIYGDIYGDVGDVRPTGEISYRAGLTYEFLPNTNAFLSYSQSFTPQFGFQLSGATLPNLTGDQYEVGVKYRSTGGRLLVTGALYEINEKNVAQFEKQVGNVAYYEPIGEVRHRGIELQILGQITPDWQINAGYSYLDPTIINNLAAQSATIGQTQLFIPKQTVSLYSTYTLNWGTAGELTLGGGVRYVSPQRTSYENALANSQLGLTASNDLPGYTLVDVTAGYTFGKWLLQLNAHNLFNRRYFINNYQTLLFGNLPGDPTNVALAIRRQF